MKKTATALTEPQKIDRLIARVESLEGATFIRNGSEHTPAEAAQHLRDKRGRAGEKLKTADQFIEQIGSRSSLSGEEYMIKYADGRSVKAQMKRADRLRVPLVVIVGGDELARGELTIKDMRSSTQVAVPRARIVHELRAATPAAPEPGRGVADRREQTA